MRATGLKPVHRRILYGDARAEAWPSERGLPVSRQDFRRRDG